MATVKPTEQGQEQRLERLAHLKKTKADLSELVALKNSPEWAKLVKLLKRYASYAAREQEIAAVDFEKDELSSEQFGKKVVRARQKKADFDFVVDLLEKTPEQVELVEAEIKRVEEIYKDAKELLA